MFKKLLELLQQNKLQCLSLVSLLIAVYESYPNARQKVLKFWQMLEMQKTLSNALAE